jgi:hypothetical protein
MAIKDWHDDWRVTTMNQEMFMDKEVDAGQEKHLQETKQCPRSQIYVRT